MKKEDWRINWLLSINELTDFDLQKTTWLGGFEDNPHWSFIEFMSCYFDDVLLGEDYGYNHFLNIGYIVREEYIIIEEWHNSLNLYIPPNNDDWDNQAIINDKNWIAIIQLGLKTKDNLLKILCEDEKLILSKNIFSSDI